MYQEMRYPDIQWEFQDPKLEVPTIYKAYVRSPQNMALYGTVPPLNRILPID